MLREPGEKARKGAPAGETAASIPATARLPVLGEASAELWEAVREGQPVVLTLHGRPALVVLDAESYAEVEALIENLAGGGRAGPVPPGSPTMASAEGSEDDVP